MVRIDNKEYAEAIAALKSEFQQIAPNTPFEYEFLDYQFNELYMAENRTKSIVGFITVLAILLALLGLYGLVSFSVQERTKEMAVRKVLGVRLPSILGLLSVGYLKILLLANLIALPAVYYIISNWLNNFNYRIDLSPALFGIGSLLVWLFVFMTIALNVYQVSKIDPVAGLRYE